jgi:hypothetical protein
MLALERSKQTATSSQLASNTAPAQPNTSYPQTLAAPSSNSSFVAPPAIAASTPAAQFQVALPTRLPMLDSHEGLPSLAGQVASRPLGTDGIGTNSNVSGQMNAQTNMPQVSNSVLVRNNVLGTQKQLVSNPTASLVSNPYFPESEAMVCTPDGKCGPASSVVPTTSQAPTQQVAGNTQIPAQKQSMHLVSNASSNIGPQFPPLPSNSPERNTVPGAPTFQPKSSTLGNYTTASSLRSDSQTSSEPNLGLIENSNQVATEPAAYNGYCPISLVKTGLKVQGTITNAVRHRGRTYLMESPEAVREFMQAPDRYSPILSGYDPMIFLESGKLVDGALEHALHDPNTGIVILFASAESQAKFKADPARNTQALGYVLNAVNKK